MNAPQFRDHARRGALRSRQRAVLVDADAYSTQYGPVTRAGHRARATARRWSCCARRGRGSASGSPIVEARIVGRGGAYAVTASGGTDYGPFTADVLVRPGAQLAIDVRRVRVRGDRLSSGRLVQTAAGPFAGALALRRLGADGRRAARRAGQATSAPTSPRGRYNATIPGQVGFHHRPRDHQRDRRCSTPTPQIVADVQIGDTALRHDRDRVGAREDQLYRRPRHRAGAGDRVERRAVPPRRQCAAGAERLSRRGSRGRRTASPFRTVNPARIRVARGGYRSAADADRLRWREWRLARLAGAMAAGWPCRRGSTGSTSQFVNALIPNLGIGGQATGSLDFAQATRRSFPTADARLTIRNFTRSGLAAVSQPVDIVFAGRSTRAAGEARALVKRGADRRRPDGRDARPASARARDHGRRG